jgi:hypothetical protein
VGIEGEDVNRKFDFLMMALGLGIFGCGGGNEASGGGRADGGGGVDAAGGSAAGGTDASGGGGAAASGGASSGGSGGGVDNRIDPISLGHAWTYDVTELGTYPLCPAGSHTGKVVSRGMVDGKDAFQTTSLCANADASYYAVDGDVVQVDYMGTWVLAVDAPVEEGHTWSNGASSFTWHEEPKVTVGAGTFDDCWRATQNVDYEAYTVFCRGVGPVHWHSADLTGNGFDATLSAKNF